MMRERGCRGACLFAATDVVACAEHARDYCVATLQACVRCMGRREIHELLAPYYTVASRRLP